MSEESEPKKKVVKSDSEASTDASSASKSSSAKKGASAEPGWVPTATAKAKSTKLRVIALVAWVIAIALEAVAIFWLLRQREWVGEDGTLVRDPETGLLQNQDAVAHFPQWAFVTLLVFLVLIAALAITGSLLWKRANRLDPARKSETVRFFVQNQLGAIISIIAFLPLIILIFLNKDMDKSQKTTAGIVGIVLALVSVVVGVDFNPPSVEKYTADQSTVIQLLGEDNVFWVSGGSVYHVCEDVSDLQTGSEIQNGTTAEAIEAGKVRLTLKFTSELQKCGLNVPENAEEITSALRDIQGGATDTFLPAPVWADPADAPIAVSEAVPAT